MCGGGGYYVFGGVGGGVRCLFRYLYYSDIGGSSLLNLCWEEGEIRRYSKENRTRVADPLINSSIHLQFKLSGSLFQINLFIFLFVMGIGEF